MRKFLDTLKFELRTIDKFNETPTEAVCMLMVVLAVLIFCVGFLGILVVKAPWFVFSVFVLWGVSYGLIRWSRT